jgi:TATA-binding protein-associated factor Taf7
MSVAFLFVPTPDEEEEEEEEEESVEDEEVEEDEEEEEVADDEEEEDDDDDDDDDDAVAEAAVLVDVEHGKHRTSSSARTQAANCATASVFVVSFLRSMGHVLLFTSQLLMHVLQNKC